MNFGLGRTNARRRVAVALLVALVAVPAFGTAPTTAALPGNNGKIVFTSSRDRAALDVYTMDPDGTNVVRITHDAIDPMFGLSYYYPTWSPAGTKIAAFRASSSVDLVIMNADGTDPVVLSGVGGTTPTWSADGLTLYFANALPNEPSHIWKIGINGSGMTQVTTGDNYDNDPAVNPAGTTIAFVRNQELATMNLNGTGVTVIAPGATDAHDPSWSPDGAKIAFSRDFHADGVWIVNANGSGTVTRLTNQNLSKPSWSPDGTRLVANRLATGAELVAIAIDGLCESTLFLPGGGINAADADWQSVSNPGVFRIPDQAGCFRATRGVSASTTVNIVRSGGFTGPVTLSIGNLPSGTTASFSPNPATGSTSTLTIKATECPNATTSGSYRLRITGVSGATSRTGYYEVVVDDGLPRVTSGPTSSLVAGKTISSTSVPVQTAWSGCDASNPISYEAQRWKASTWSSAATGGTKTIAPSLAFKTTYRYRVRVVDPTDDYSPYAYGPYFQPRLTQQSSTSIKYTGSWASTSYSSYAGGTSKNAKTAGASASYTFTGSSIAWIGAVSSSRGSAAVYIDGVLKATVSTYATTTAYRRVLYAFNWTSQGSHTIKIVVVGTAGHPRVDVDAFVRLYRT